MSFKSAKYQNILTTYLKIFLNEVIFVNFTLFSPVILFELFISQNYHKNVKLLAYIFFPSLFRLDFLLSFWFYKLASNEGKTQFRILIPKMKKCAYIRTITPKIRRMCSLHVVTGLFYFLHRLLKILKIQFRSWKNIWSMCELSLRTQVGWTCLLYISLLVCLS